jgi:serine/threonine protein kinase
MFFIIFIEITEDGPAAESFIGTLAYMSPARIHGVTEYSFEADMWSLGITMITIITGNIPYPTANGSWQLMNAILEGPQPTLNKEDVSAEMHDFIHQCLNQPLRDKSCVQKLLGHAFLTSAKDRGILSLHKPAILAKRGKLMQFDLPTNTTMERIVEVAVSWQLERLEDGPPIPSPMTKSEKNRHVTKPPIREIPRFSMPQLEWLAFQMSAQASDLKEKYVIIEFYVENFYLYLFFLH